MHDRAEGRRVAYMLWLAWKIAHAAAPSRRPVRARPLTFVQAAAFQWVNPKAWAMALGAVSVYAKRRRSWVHWPWWRRCLPREPALRQPWVLRARQMRHLADQPRPAGVFNWTMAGLLVRHSARPDDLGAA